MANEAHLRILQKGAESWNDWRHENPRIRPQLSGVDLKDFKFCDFDLRQVQLGAAKLQRANFCQASMGGADLSGADLFEARFQEVDLSKASVRGANLTRADFLLAILSDADFSGSDFHLATLHHADFSNASLVAADLSGAILEGADLSNVDLTGAKIGGTVFVRIDLSVVRGLDTVQHFGPSPIDFDTLLYSHGKISEKFLRDSGLPDALVTYLPSLLGAIEPIQWYSCFISYSTKNQKFADRLHARMRQAGLRVWFDREDMKSGDYLHTQIDRAIQLHDRLLLVLSEESIQSKWVEREIRRTRKIERAEKRRKLFPIRLVDMKTLREWECLDSDTGEDLAEEVRKYHIPDFSNWKNHDAFETAFARLERGLRTSILGK